MPKVYTYSETLPADIVDAFCALQKGFTDQFVYYDKEKRLRFFGLGRCIAVQSVDEIDEVRQGSADIATVLFSYDRFDAENPAPADELFSSYPRLRFLLPEVVLVQDDRGTFLQVNSLGPVYPGRVDRFAREAARAKRRERVTIPYTLTEDSRDAWRSEVADALRAIRGEKVDKVVLSRRLRLTAEHPFSSKDLLINLIDGPSRGVVFMYRYGDVFFCGCTPELLVRKHGSLMETECLAGTCPQSADPADSQIKANGLLHDEKNLREHAFVVDFIRAVVERNCYDVSIPASPTIKVLPHVQHLHTPIRARMMDGRSIENLADQLSPTPALSGSPVGEAMMLIRRIEPYNRGFFGGSIGVVDTEGDGAFNVSIRSGVFDGEAGYVYAGCGIVEGSGADSEYDEIEMKLKTILSAFDGGER
ncbi:isochorismate synthase [Curtanaerobium respiraculi]|uniref:isochorismate synthase n=1 Tax=Curtanaerobium respiraculi TaxID=2949669 RepID=UPI0024B3948D|nr:isochorismate synthase [Curtanaerobium respiraculi]